MRALITTVTLGHSARGTAVWEKSIWHVRRLRAFGKDRKETFREATREYIFVSMVDLSLISIAV